MAWGGRCVGATRGQVALVDTGTRSFYASWTNIDDLPWKNGNVANERLFEVKSGHRKSLEVKLQSKWSNKAQIGPLFQLRWLLLSREKAGWNTCNIHITDSNNTICFSMSVLYRRVSFAVYIIRRLELIRMKWKSGGTNIPINPEWTFISLKWKI